MIHDLFSFSGDIMNGNGKSKSSSIEKSRTKILKIQKTLNSLVIGRETSVKLVLLSMIAKENMAIIGPPGTAKSYLIRNLAKLLKASIAMYQFHRHTRDVEVLGPFDVKKFVEEGELIRKLSKLFKADIAYLDEAFKASSAILNALLSALQEHVIYDPLTGSELPVQTKFFIVTSNEVPQEEELQALYDRFPVRDFVHYLDDDSLILRALEARWLNNHSTTPVATWEDIETLSSYAQKIIQSSIKGLGKFIMLYHTSTISFVKSLRTRGILVSDRTIIEKLPKLIAANCALYGLTMDNITNAVIDFLPHLARDASEHEEIKKAIMEELGEVAELHEKLQRSKALAKAGNLSEAIKQLREIIEFDMTKIAKKPWLKKRIEAIISEANIMMRKYSEILQTLKQMSENL